MKISRYSRVVSGELAVKTPEKGEANAKDLANDRNAWTDA
jgi:hypothetical protein